jgi:hypothetical protein
LTSRLHAYLYAIDEPSRRDLVPSALLYIFQCFSEEVREM